MFLDLNKEIMEIISKESKPKKKANKNMFLRPATTKNSEKIELNSLHKTINKNNTMINKNTDQIEEEKQINKKATGAVINTILRKDLENISIPLLDIKKQEKIVRLYQANKRLQEALAQKMKLINNINEVAISKLLQ